MATFRHLILKFVPVEQSEILSFQFLSVGLG